MSTRVRSILGVIARNLMIPPPLWFWVAGMLMLLPGAWLGAHAGVSR